jgi:YD repeat-containing protein
LLTESFSGGPLSGLSVTNRYDALLRRTNLVFGGAGMVNQTLYTFDTSSRLQLVSNAALGVTYGYLTNSGLVRALTFADSGAVRLAVTNTFDSLNRLTRRASVPSASSAGTLSYDYAYNSANQRMAVTNADASRWDYGYDTLGQVTNGVKRWSDASLVAGQQFEYAFDDIGNRRWTRSGGNGAGANLRQSSHTNNLLNQITGRSVPGYVEVLGTAATNATVTVNYTATERQGEYFRAELTVTNGSGPVWQGITNLAVISPGGTMLDAAFTVCSGLKALASATNDTRLAAQADFSPSDLARGREADVMNRCQSVLALGNGNAAALAAKYHVTAADLTALQGAITAFAAVQPMPRQGRAASAAELRNLFARLDETLNSKLDPLLARFRFTQPSFHEEYLTARTIVDSTGSRALKDSTPPAPLANAA